MAGLSHSPPAGRKPRYHRARGGISYMALSVRFDPTGPYDVDTTDAPFARPAGTELLARLYNPKGEPVRPLAALVYVHGGAWARLDRAADSILCQALAAS